MTVGQMIDALEDLHPDLPIYVDVSLSDTRSQLEPVFSAQTVDVGDPEDFNDGAFIVVVSVT